MHLAFLAVLVTTTVVGEAPPASAARCEGSTGGGFEKPEYEVAEDRGYVDLTVCPGWGPAWQGEIDYRTSDITATAGHDYQQTSGTMTFLGEGGGCYSCVVRVPITNDDLLENEESFELRLTAYRGTFVQRGRESVIVRIVDSQRNQASGGSATHESGSQSGSGARLPTPSVASGAGSTDAGQAGAGENIPTNVGEPEPQNRGLAGFELARSPAEARDAPESSARPAWLGILLLLTLLAGSFWVKRKTGSRP